MEHAAKLIGLLHRPVPHDLRRGAAAELDRHGRKLEGGAERAAQRALGHSEKAAAQGLTKDYIGPIREDTWALRVTSGPMTLAEHDLNFVETGAPYRPPPKLPPGAITAACEAKGLDPALKQNRRHMSKQARDKHFDDWLARQRALADQDRDQDPDEVAPAGTETAVATTDSGELAAPAAGTGVDIADHGFRPVPPAMTAVGYDDADNIPIDPALLELETVLVVDGDVTETLVNNITVPGDGRLGTVSLSWGDGTTPPALLSRDSVAGGDENDQCRILAAGRDGFAHFFATINLQRFTRTSTPGFQRAFTEVARRFRG
jgi:hypothetical protein